MIFDCDGMLMDTESLWFRSQEAVGNRHGVVINSNLQQRLVGMASGPVAAVIAEMAQKDQSKILEELLLHYADRIQSDGRAMPGAYQIVAAIAECLPMAVASNSTRDILSQTLRRGGFAKTFQVTVSSDEVAKPKPAPDVYLAAASGLGLSPDDCLAFEDSDAGVAAAMAAGLKVVAIPDRPRNVHEANWLCESLECGDLVQWVRKWPGRRTPADPLFGEQ